jgi:hypothetical protein
LLDRPDLDLFSGGQSRESAGRLRTTAVAFGVWLAFCDSPSFKPLTFSAAPQIPAPSPLGLRPSTSQPVLQIPAPSLLGAILVRLRMTAAACGVWLIFARLEFRMNRMGVRTGQYGSWLFGRKCPASMTILVGAQRGRSPTSKANPGLRISDHCVYGSLPLAAMLAIRAGPIRLSTQSDQVGDGQARCGRHSAGCSRSLSQSR